MNRGKPLPWALREQIKQRINDKQSKSRVARELGLSRNTVLRYAPKTDKQV